MGAQWILFCHIRAKLARYLGNFPVDLPFYLVFLICILGKIRSCPPSEHLSRTPMWVGYDILTRIALAIWSSEYDYKNIDIFSTDRQIDRPTDRQTNRPRRVDIKAPIPELKNKLSTLSIHLSRQVWKSWNSSLNMQQKLLRPQQIRCQHSI